MLSGHLQEVLRSLDTSPPLQETGITLDAVDHDRHLHRDTEMTGILIMKVMVTSVTIPPLPSQEVLTPGIYEHKNLQHQNMRNLIKVLHRVHLVGP